MINLILNVFLLSEEQEDDLEEGQQIRFEECDLVEHIFYRIEYIRPFLNGRHCQLSSGGDLFITKESYAKVKEKIQERLTFLYN